jgi:hypothetical protein
VFTGAASLVASVPHDHWKTLAFIAALRVDGLTAPYIIDCAMDGVTFMAYVQQLLVPTLAKGDIVFTDRTHKNDTKPSPLLAPDQSANCFRHAGYWYQVESALPLDTFGSIGSDPLSPVSSSQVHG